MSGRGRRSSSHAACAPTTSIDTTTAPGTTAAASCALLDFIASAGTSPSADPFDGGTWTYYDTSAAEAAAAAASAAVLEAAAELTAILETSETLDEGSAQSVTEFLSLLIEEETAIDQQVDEQSTEQITNAVQELARAVTADDGSGGASDDEEVTLRSPNLNLTAQAAGLGPRGGADRVRDGRRHADCGCIAAKCARRGRRREYFPAGVRAPLYLQGESTQAVRRYRRQWPADERQLRGQIQKLERHVARRR